LNQLNDVELAAVRNRKLGFVFQFHYLLPQCSVLENVLVPTLAKVKLPLLGERAGVRGTQTGDSYGRVEVRTPHATFTDYFREHHYATRLHCGDTPK
jgi:ABC-type sugar transport system ATPase subunit